MGSDRPFDVAAFKQHLDQIYPDKIIDDTYPVRPPAFSAARSEPQPESQSKPQAEPQFKPSSPPVVAQDGAASARTVEVSATGSDSGPATVAESDPLAAERAVRAEHLRVQKTFLADPSKMREILPALLLKCDTNSDHSLDQNEITNGLKNDKITGPESDALTVMLSGFKTIHSEHIKHDTQGISDFDFAVLEKALDRKIDGDPIYHKESIETIPKSLVSGALASMAVTKGAPGKEKLIYAGAMAVTNLALQEGFLGILQLFNANDGKYNDVQKAYLDFERSYKL